jgi:hypothetical protein
MNNNLNKIKTTGFNTPKDYFESFDKKLLSKLASKNQLDTIKSTGFNIPEGYFETVDEIIFNKVENKKETKVVQLFSWKKVAYTSAIAASLILMFNIFNPSDELTFDALEMATIENYLFDEDFLSYEIASLLTLDDLNSDVFTNTNISEATLEDYLLDNTNIEDLLIE